MKEYIFFDKTADRYYILDNGLTVILKKSKFLPVVSVQLWVKVGSIYETEQLNGISHFLEHLVFKSTTKYKINEISKKIERYGGVINAGTSKEFTMYFVDIPSEGLEDALDVVSQLVFEATFLEEELERERDVVIEEIKRFEDNPVNVLYENFNKLLFTTTPYKQRILGTEENIKNLTKQQIVDYYKTFYVPNRMVLVICGDIEYDKVEGLIKNYFGKYNNVLTSQLSFSLDETHKPDTLEIKKHKVQHTYFICGFLGPKIDERHQYTGDVLSIILGEGLSSRLYRILREEKKLVYDIGSGFYPQLGNSIFYISGICERRNLDSVIKEIRSIINELKNYGPKDTELQKAKQIVITRWHFNNETVHSKAATLAWWAIYKTVDELNCYIENINKIGKDDIKEFLSTYGEHLVVSVLEPE